MKKWMEDNPEKRQAHMVINLAVASKKIKQEPCEVCGELKTHAHHEDYNKPLSIKWLCPKHHKECHNER